MVTINRHDNKGLHRPYRPSYLVETLDGGFTAVSTLHEARCLARYRILDGAEDAYIVIYKPIEERVG